jgi:hypothetical protein
MAPISDGRTRRRLIVKKPGGWLLLITLVLCPVMSRAADKPASQPISVRFLFQPQVQFTEKDAPDADSWGKEAFIRRARIIVAGAVSDRISFFAETDVPNWGKNGNWTGSLCIQDAYIDYLLVKDGGFINNLHLAAGLILLPFSHNERQTVATLNTLDFHGAVIQFPTGSTKVWRDNGLEARGLFWNKHLDIRIGVFNGLRGNAADARPVNAKDSPRFTGRVQYNFLDAEEGFFYGGNYLGAKKILSIGAGLDTMADYRATTLDLFVDYPLRSDLGLVFQADYFHYSPEPERLGPGFDAPNGRAYDLEAGLRYKNLEPVFSYERFNPENAALRPMDFAENLRFGLNWWIMGHTANLKAEYARLKTRDALSADKTRGQWTLQAQVFY